MIKNLPPVLPLPILLLPILLFAQMLVISQANAQGEPTQEEREFSSAWLAKTSKTDSDDDLLIAAMFARQFQPSEVSKFLSIERSNPSYNKLRLNLTAYYCLLNDDTSFCEGSLYDEQLISNDPDNVEPYIYSMLRLSKSNNDAAALLALNAANRTAQTNNYYFTKVKLARKKLATAGYPEVRRNAASEFLAGALPMYTIYGKMLSLCKEKSVESTDWKDQCLSLGRRLETKGKTAMQFVFGNALQLSCLGKTSSEEKERSIVAARKEAFNLLRDKAGKKLPWWSNWSLKSDGLYKDMIELGEIEAIKKALKAGQP